MENKKLLIVCGPTATGKTQLGVSLAKKFHGEILSADSRQVYKEMNIGTGKDVGTSKFVGAKLTPDTRHKNIRFGYYEKEGIKIWGLDIVSPDYPFNLQDYLYYSEKVLNDIWKREKLPVVVGGTGLYVKGILFPPETVNIRPNQKLRRTLEDFSLTKLKKTLQKADRLKWSKMNASDQTNPRRLVRAIEVALYKKEHPKSKNVLPSLGADTFSIGLELPRGDLYLTIDKRVDQRIEQGMEKEVRRLLGLGLSRTAQSLSSTGYREFFSELEHSTARLTKETLQGIIQRWKFSEHAYARRQLTWFKKQKDVNWFDLTRKNWKRKVTKLTVSWYN